jgi:hypothetical protein
MRQQVVEIAAKLYQARESVRRLFPVNWPQAVAPHMRCIRALVLNRKLSVVEATKTCITEAMNQGQPETATLFMAACVEILEPTVATRTEPPKQERKPCTAKPSSP